MEPEAAAGGGRSKSTSTTKTTRRRAAVVYYLCRSRQGELEHPHLMEVEVGRQLQLRLRDVTRRLDVVRGRGMAAMYSWSCKRSYRAGFFVWHDLSHPDDMLSPTPAGDYVLKASLLPHPITPPPPPPPPPPRHHHRCHPHRQLQAAHVSASTATANDDDDSPSPSAAYHRTRTPPHSSSPPPSSSFSSGSSASSSPNNSNKLMATAAVARISPAAVGVAAATQTQAETETDDKSALAQGQKLPPLQGQGQGKIILEQAAAARGGLGSRSSSSRTLESLIMADSALIRRMLEDAQDDTDSSSCSMSMGSIYRVKPADLLMRLLACGTSLPPPATCVCINDDKFKTKKKKKNRHPELMKPQLESLPYSPVLSPLALVRHPPPPPTVREPPAPQHHHQQFSGRKLEQLQDRHRGVAAAEVPLPAAESANAAFNCRPAAAGTIEESEKHRLSADASAGKNRKGGFQIRMDERSNNPSTPPTSSRPVSAFHNVRNADKTIKIEERWY